VALAVTTAPWAAGAFAGSAAGGIAMSKLGRRVLRRAGVEAAGLLAIWRCCAASAATFHRGLLAPMVIGGIRDGYGVRAAV
jgi:hypothetical protein